MWFVARISLVASVTNIHMIKEDTKSYRSSYWRSARTHDRCYRKEIRNDLLSFALITLYLSFFSFQFKQRRWNYTAWDLLDPLRVYRYFKLHIQFCSYSSLTTATTSSPSSFIADWVSCVLKTRKVLFRGAVCRPRIAVRCIAWCSLEIPQSSAK
jgi:hypothetical protein